VEQTESLLASLSVRKISGDNQWIIPGQPPSEPFVVQLVFGEAAAPVAGMAIVLKLEGRDAPLASATTDESGTARLALTEPLPPAGPAPEVVAEVSLAGLAPEESDLKLEGPRAAFLCAARSADTVQFAVCLREKTPEGAVVPTMAESALRRAMEEGGLKVVDPAAVRAALQAVPASAAGWEEAALAALLDLTPPDPAAGHVLVLLGTLQVSLTGQEEVDDGVLYFSQAPFNATVVDPALAPDSRTVVEVSGKGSSAYLGDPLQALKRARSEASAQICQLAVAEIESRLGAAAAGPVEP
jgi:hypothetical protein